MRKSKNFNSVQYADDDCDNYTDNKFEIKIEFIFILCVILIITLYLYLKKSPV